MQVLLLELTKTIKGTVLSRINPDNENHYPNLKAIF